MARRPVDGTEWKADTPVTGNVTLWIFTGWYNGDTKWEFDTPVTGKVTGLAKGNAVKSRKSSNAKVASGKKATVKVTVQKKEVKTTKITGVAKKAGKAKITVKSGSKKVVMTITVKKK